MRECCGQEGGERARCCRLEVWVLSLTISPRLWPDGNGHGGGAGLEGVLIINVLCYNDVSKVGCLVTS